MLFTGTVPVGLRWANWPTQCNPTNFVSPHRLGLVSLTAPRNPNLTFHNGFKMLQSAVPLKYKKFTCDVFLIHRYFTYL